MDRKWAEEDILRTQQNGKSLGSKKDKQSYGLYTSDQGNENEIFTSPSKYLNWCLAENYLLTTSLKIVRLTYGLQAFPKLNDLLEEYRSLKEDLHKLFTFFGKTIPMSEEQKFVYADVLQNPYIRHVYVNVIDKEENLEIIKKLVSPKYEPQNIENICHADFKYNYDPLESFLHSPPEIYICWIAKDINQAVLEQLLEDLRKINRNTRIIIVTDSKNITDVEEKIRHTCNISDAPNICHSSQENIRKDVTFTLSEFLFERLSVLKEILLGYKENISILLNNLTDTKRKSLSEIVQMQVRLNHELPANDVRDVSDPYRQELSKLLETKIFQVISLQQENPKKRSDGEHKDIPQDLIDKLERLQKRGVEAFGLLSNEFRVHINCEQLTENEIKEVETEIREIIRGEYTRLRTIHCDGQIVVKYVENGDKLFRDDSIASKYGTLGIFACDSTGNLIALTSEHVINEGQKAYVDIDGTRVVLGVCNKTTALDETCRHSSDISLIKIYENNFSQCNIEFKGKAGDNVQPDLFTGQSIDLKYRRVYKKGAKTNLTKGRVKGTLHQTSDGHSVYQSIIIEDLDEAFCEKGDSGSIVFTYDIHDPENTKIHLVSMVVGGYKDSKNEYLTYRLDETLKRLPPNAIQFGKQN